MRVSGVLVLDEHSAGAHGEKDREVFHSLPLARDDAKGQLPHGSIRNTTPNPLHVMDRSPFVLSASTTLAKQRTMIPIAAMTMVARPSLTALA